MPRAFNAPVPTGNMRPAMNRNGKPLLWAVYDSANPYTPKVFNRPALIEVPRAFASGDRYGEHAEGELLSAGLAGVHVRNAAPGLYYAGYYGLVRVVNGGHSTVTATLGVSGFGGAGNRSANARVGLCARIKEAEDSYFYVEVAGPLDPGEANLTEANPSQVYGAALLGQYAIFIDVLAVADDGETGGEVWVDLAYA